MTCPDLPRPDVTLSRVLYDLRTVLWRLVPADARWLRVTFEDPPEMLAWEALKRPGLTDAERWHLIELMRAGKPATRPKRGTPHMEVHP